MINGNMTTCHGAIDGYELLEEGCFLRGNPGSRVAGALKSCCPEILAFRPEFGNQSGTNCYVYCNKTTAQQADEANPCMIKYYDDHPGKDTQDERKNIWTCDTPDTRNEAVSRMTSSWGGLVVLSLLVSTAVGFL